MGTLSIFECTGIQDYVFGSNRLLENLGASQFVDEALGDRCFLSLLKKVDPKARLDWEDRTEWLDDTSVIEVLYVGGGNAAVYFPNVDMAKKVTCLWSRKLLREAPGLRPAAWHLDYSNNGQPLHEALDEAFKELDHVKRAPTLDRGLQCLPMTRRCASTGLAATGYVVEEKKEKDRRKEWLSGEVLAKRGYDPLKPPRGEKPPKGNVLDRAKDHLTSEFSAALEHFVLTNQIDELCDKRDNPHVAVVHIDGNSVGDLIRSATEGKKPEEAAASLRALSAAIAEANREALKKTMEWVSEAWKKEIAQRDGKAIFPVRPIVFGGDDVTLVSNGSLGLQISVEYLKALEAASAQRKEALQGKSLTACAGVAIVRSHFPFSRAYATAEALCREAKREARKQEKTSWLDFQVIMSGATGDLRALREDYRLHAKEHLWRPWRVTPDKGDHHDWSLLYDAVSTLADEGGEKQWATWRKKGLRDAFQLGGPAAVESLLSQYASRKIPMPRLFEEAPHMAGYHGMATAFVDVLEAEEFILIPEDERKANGGKP